jgi:hypothetical protein
MPKKRYTPEEILQHLRAIELETGEGLKHAREAKNGLRTDPQPVPPWEWRKGRRPTIAPIWCGGAYYQA